MGRHGTIAGRKEAQDRKRAASFTKFVRLITVAARNGADPEYNVALKHAIEKAKAINMPNDNIMRAVKKGSGTDGSTAYESLNYEGYGPGGVAIIVEGLTDNKNRTVSSIKTAFDRNGGNLGVSGCVSYMFERKGVIIIEKTDKNVEDEIMDIALEADMEDMQTYDDSFYITTSTDSFDSVSSALRNAGYELIEADIEYVPSIEVETLSEIDHEKLKKLIDVLENDDDVQKVHHNYAGEF
ncbi:YebC/PmpR family DNA-binding transcriptional regulator [Leptotrichia sp. OH3620_COT-345]|uniref:YebC/PmpR family DNA-binding transcriptional regulator n=1 Tax=Leptotrichia sp. OH3620_COT-345 TaxID=2491048 RepID=UPI000F650BDB|nr:YebC/PmpR family DNA-binding transcriptional regulator [Leptotrichia sp. OH3620_COT-345]RRD40188.1 YebC/PmpR family DNA-binding transcriptional regulator [Leptotrichia sp. OH3620_COT-345]